MADRIKGITIELDGETTGLKKALKDVTDQSVSASRELKDINRLLKFDPSNTELLAQKQKALSSALDATTTKLNKLKEAQEQVNGQFASGKISTEQYNAFNREIQDTEIRLKSLTDRLKESNPQIESFQVKMSETGEKLKSTGESISGVGSKLSTGVTLPLVGVATAAVKVGNDFEAQMSRVKAISGATGQDFADLKQQAIDLGQSTAFSAGEVAQGMENLASAGFSTKEIMEAMPGMLDLAASSGEDLASSADIAASTLRGFGLEADQAGHVADVLAKNAADTNAAVADTGEAMKYVAPAAKAAGLSLEEVTAAIGVMANSGIQGSQAGTTLRSALTRLASPSKEAAGLMEQLGFKAFDSEGKMLSLSDIINNLQTSTAGLTDEQKQNAIATIFGQEAMSGMLTLIDTGGDQIDTLADGLKNADGAASDMATTMQDNTSSAIEQMGGALETAGIKIQESLAPVITSIANFVGNLATAFSNLSPTMQQIILVIAGIVAAIGPLLVIVGSIISAIGTIATAIGTTSVVVLGVVAGIVAGIAAVIAIGVLLYQNWDTISQVASTVWNGIATFFTETIPNAFNSLGTFFTSTVPQIFSDLWTTITTAFTDGWNGVVTFFTESVPAWIASMGEWFAQLPNSIAYGLGEAVGSIISWGVNVFNYLTTNVPMWISSIGTWFSQLPGNIWTWLVNVVTNLGTWGSNVISWIGTNVSSWITNIVNYFTQLPGQIWTWLTNCVTNMTTWGGDMLTEASTGMTNVFNGIVDTFTNLPSKMTEIGTNIVAGIKQGISDAWEGMKGWIGGLCDSFIDGVKDSLDIHSPSRVMRELGNFTGEGFGLGIGDTVNSISKQANNLANAAIPNVEQSKVDIGTNLNTIGGNNSVSTGGNLDAILTKMDSLVEAFNNMGIYMDSTKVGKLVSGSVSNNIAFNGSRKGFA